MHSSDIAFGVAAFFLLGIAAANFGWNITATIIVYLLLSTVYLVFIRKAKFLKHLFLSAVFIFLGFFYYNFYLNLQDAGRNVSFDQKIKFSAIAIDEPRQFEKYQTVSAKLLPPLSGGVEILASPLPVISYGDVLAIDGVIKEPLSRVEKPVVVFPKIKTLEKNRGFWLKVKLIAFKNYLLGSFDKFLDRDQAALLGGITLGSRSDFSDELRKAMSASGTTHLVALSGYNITILVLAVSYALKRIFSRRHVFYLTAATIILFVIMVGGEPSVIRAAIMGFLALWAKEIGRAYSARNAIAITAAAMAVFDPTIIRYNAGFQLSFMSLLGIIYLAPVIKNFFHVRENGWLGFKENAVVTVSAQLAVLPIIVATFGEFSLTAIFANILILEFIPITMFLGFLLATLSSIYIYLGFFVAKLTELLLSYELWIINSFSGLRLPIKFLPEIKWPIAIAYYTVLAILIFIGNRKNIFQPKNG